MKRFLVILVSAVVLASPSLTSAPGSTPQADTLFQIVAMRHFQLNLDHYMTLKQKALATVSAPGFPARPHALLARTRALASAIRTLRPAAHPGDIFTADVRSAFRLMVAYSMAVNGDTTACMIARAREDAVPCDVYPEVNEPFPWQRGAMMPPYLLATLPSLPAGLQYRIVERDLILLDLDSNLVVDILKDALPPEAGAMPHDAGR